MPADRARDLAADLAALHPLDEHNRRLQGNVHPPDWRNPEPRKRYDLVVLGAGTGGLVSAAIGAGLGARVALVERHLMGGDCLNVGCVPSKAMIRAAGAWSAARDAADRFGGPAARVEHGDFAAAMERMRRVRAEISAVDGAERFRDLGVDVFLGEGRFTAPDRVEVGGAPLRFRRAIVATGTRPTAPPVPGLEQAGYLTNETVFSLTERPHRLLVLGGGPIGCELAQAFARFGTEVTLLEREERLLTRDDPDAAAVVRAALARDGVRVVTGAEIRSVEREGRRVRAAYAVGGRAVDAVADELLVAAGRAPNLEGLGLEAAGIHHGERGVEVDRRLRTSNGHVYAVGDVTGRHPFTHVADAHARIAVQNALFFRRLDVEDLVVPWCTYTSPELAHVGIRVEEAAERGVKLDTITVAMAEVDRARIDGETEGFLRVHLEKGSDRILGATLVGAHAGDIVSQITASMRAGTGLGTLSETVFPYPTRAEIIRKAADTHRRGRLTPRARKGFALYFRLFR
jgi:pyruvate/2-oxoglutarate dehydrogenase complex dihydrolipoamide dehydrogenase (E3) component